MNGLALLVALLFTVSAWAGEAHWIDVRSAEEFAAGHVENAVNIPHTEIGERIAEVTENRDATLYLYCRSGRRSGIAADVLEQAGFTHAVNVGGFEDAMKKAGQTETK
jgi:phage shock protein E